MITPTYTIAMCNHNMENTLERSLSSILDQLDERFEVLVVDDGSNDDSVAVIRSLQKKYPALRLIELKRDQKRKLGMTRNISVRESRGKYVLLHLDCDDVYGPFLSDFVTVFHQIEDAIGRDILICGKHINMAKRSFLLDYGPYRNIFRGEDRDLWIRTAAKESLIILDHTNFVKRLPKDSTQSTWRALHHTLSHLVTEFRTGMSLAEFFKHEKKRKQRISKSLYMFRKLVILPAFIISKFYSPLPLPPETRRPDDFKKYRESHTGTFTELMERYGGKPDFSDLSEDAKAHFS